MQLIVDDLPHSPCCIFNSEGVTFTGMYMKNWLHKLSFVRKGQPCCNPCTVGSIVSHSNKSAKRTYESPQHCKIELKCGSFCKTASSQSYRICDKVNRQVVSYFLPLLVQKHIMQLVGCLVDGNWAHTGTQHHILWRNGHFVSSFLYIHTLQLVQIWHIYWGERSETPLFWVVRNWKTWYHVEVMVRRVHFIYGWLVGSLNKA